MTIPFISTYSNICLVSQIIKKTIAPTMTCIGRIIKFEQGKYLKK